MIATIVLAAATAAAAWHDARALVLPKIASQTNASLALPQFVDGGPSNAYPDVRIADERNQEVPYALDADPAAAAATFVDLSDVGFVPGSYTQAIADLGTSGELHSAITIETTQQTFFEHVQIATSDDRKTWAVVTPDALIYRVTAYEDGQNTVAYGPSRARWVRIRILDGAHAFPIDRASVPARSAPPKLYPLQGSTTVKNAGGQTVVTIDFGTPNTNIGAIAFETRTPLFSRHAAFSVSDGTAGSAGLAWEDAGDQKISRFATGEPVLGARLGDQHARLLRVTIDNGNDPPLAALRVTALGYAHHLIFIARPGAQYRLLWNNPDAVAPTYDLADKLEHEDWNVGAVAALGAAASTAFAGGTGPAPASTPWLQQAALPIALAVGLLVLAVVAVSALRTKPVS